MPFDGTTRVSPAPASFGEAAVALMLARARDGSKADLLTELRVLAESRSPAARLWDAYTHGRPARHSRAAPRPIDPARERLAAPRSERAVFARAVALALLYSNE
jgi:hypothetical protein